VLNFGTQNFSHLVQGEHFHIGVEWTRGRKFNGKLAVSGKRWEIRPRLLLITSRKWHTPCQTKWESLILNDFDIDMTRYFG